ncbi:MAG: FAD-dependent oxidoreductase [Candidatus Buchananbacteria bacterium]|nr:FAD-dependent oxidoreductase [Candidatus Buchananbacteria bacterium]
MIYDVIIIGGGPGGVAAAVYAARKKMKTLLLAYSFGGQSVVSDQIENWIGEKNISGFELGKRLEAHARNFPDVVDVQTGRKAVGVKKVPVSDKQSVRAFDFVVTVDDRKQYTAKTVIVASGASRRRLDVPGEVEFNGKGVSYCSTCDAPLFNGKAVAVIGGGNAGVEAVIDLLPYADKIYLISNTNKLKADPVSQDQISGNPKVIKIFNAKIIQIFGHTLVSGLKYLDQSDQEQTLKVEGIFVEIGSMPNSDLVRDIVKLDKYAQIMINSRHASTSEPGIFAAGDVTNDPYKQNNISAGDGVKAALAAYNYILNKKKRTPAADKGIMKK